MQGEVNNLDNTAFSEDTMEWNYNMTDYIVYYQDYNPKTQSWDYRQQIFNSEGSAKSFAFGILKNNPDNGLMVKSKEYKLFIENGRPVKKYIGRENYIVKSTEDSHKQLVQEMSEAAKL
jgi:hypothetical protein